MENNVNTEIDEAIDLDAEESVEEELDESFEEPVDVDADADDDFEYDENGDIIIPDDEDEENTGDEQDEDSDSDDEADEQPEEDVEPAFTETEDKDRQIAELRRELEELRSQGKDTLAKLGVEDEDVMNGLVRLAAEADDKTPEEYLRQRNEKTRADEAMKALQRLEFEKLMKEDLAQIHAAFPETRKYDSVTKLPNFQRFGQLRDAKLSPKEAYIASHPDEVMQGVANATKKSNLSDTKKHLSPAVSKSSHDRSTMITKAEIAQYREIFPNMSDKEIVSLYRQAQKK